MIKREIRKRVRRFEKKYRMARKENSRLGSAVFYTNNWRKRHGKPLLRFGKDHYARVYEFIGW